jgi:hypothetical protein
MGQKQWAKPLRLISRNALVSGSARITIEAIYYTPYSNRTKGAKPAIPPGSKSTSPFFSGGVASLNQWRIAQYPFWMKIPSG